MNLTIESQTERLSLVREFVSGAAHQYGFDDETVDKIALAVDEACTNIIKHAYEYAADKNIDIRIEASATAFEVTVVDQGKSFSPELVQSPNMNEYMRQYRRGGLGMYLMKSLMDKVEYKAFPGKRNEVRLVKYRPLRNASSE